MDGLESDGVYSDNCSGDWSVGRTFGVKHLVDILCGDGQLRLRWFGERRESDGEMEVEVGDVRG